MNLLSYVAIALLQIAPLSALYSVVFLGQSYPVSTCILFIAGLGILTIHSILNREKLYIWGNVSGLIANLILLWWLL